MLRRRGEMSLCTVVAIALPTELPGAAEVLLAGHPPPLLVRDGVARPIGEAGPMLGAVEAAEGLPCASSSRRTTSSCLYTDGVTDSVLPGGERFGEARLRRLAERAGSDVDALEGELAIRCPGPPALLARGTFGEEAEPLLELSLAGGPAAPSAARRSLAAALDGRRLSERAQGDALIVVSDPSPTRSATAARARRATSSSCTRRCATRCCGSR